jgi:hypothetical protein
MPTKADRISNLLAAARSRRDMAANARRRGNMGQAYAHSVAADGYEQEAKALARQTGSWS